MQQPDHHHMIKTIADCSSHTVPDAELAAFLFFVLDDTAQGNPTNEVIREAADTLVLDPANRLARLAVTALGLDDVFIERTAVLYATWILSGRPGLHTTGDA